MHSQSLCIVVLAVILLKPAESALTFEQMEKAVTPFRNKCLEKTGADVASVDAIRKGIFAEDTATKCYIACICKSLRTMNKDGQVDVDMILKQMDALMPPDIAAKMKGASQKCASIVTSDDICEKAYQFSKCTYQEAPDVFFFP